MPRRQTYSKYCQSCVAFVIAFACCLTLQTKAQQADYKLPRCDMSVFLSTSHSFYANLRRQPFNELFCYRQGLLIQFKASPAIRVGSGLLLDIRNYKAVDVPPPGSFQVLNYQSRLLEIPFRIYIRVGDRKESPVIIAGFNEGFLFANKTTYLHPDGSAHTKTSRNSFRGFNSFSSFFHLGLSLNFRSGKNTFHVIPFYEANLDKHSLRSLSTLHLRAGIALAFSFGLIQ